MVPYVEIGAAMLLYAHSSMVCIQETEKHRPVNPNPYYIAARKYPASVDVLNKHKALYSDKGIRPRLRQPQPSARYHPLGDFQQAVLLLSRGVGNGWHVLM